MTDLKQFYDDLVKENPQMKFRDLICEECGITIPTFYKWLNGETKRIPKNSKEKISELTNIPVEELFPE